MLKNSALRKSILPGIIALAWCFSSCVKKIDDYKTLGTAGEPVTDMQSMVVSPNFTYDNSKEIAVDLHLLDNDDGPIAGVKVNFMTDAPENGGTVVATAFSQADGSINTTVKIPSTQTQLIINTNFIGLVNNVISETTGSNISLTIGGSNPQDFPTARVMVPSPLSQSSNRSASMPSLSYLGTWNNLGVPNYLSTPRSHVGASFIQRINRSLPENKSVPSRHPQFLNASNKVVLTQGADVYATFIHDGAAYKSTLTYFAYNKNSPPTSTSDIANLKVVFPNASYRNSGGGLISGDKVFLGHFGTDTVIGFALLSNAYNSSTHTIGNGYAQYYSVADFNPENSSSNRIHTVYLWDDTENKMVVGFEDLNRDNGSDNDFNDNIFTVSTVPSSAMSSSNIERTIAPHDSDNDGCDDEDDEYPNDGNNAYNSYYPTPQIFGHLAFEDLWPYHGDFDFNDLIVGYRFHLIKNSQNKVTAMDAKFYVKAAGGSFRNGFGFELPVPPSFIQSATGGNLQMNYISQNGNGTEAGQTNAVFIAFDNSENIAKRPAGYYVNTQAGSPVVASDTVNMHIVFVTAMSESALGNEPYNPFIFTNQHRGTEVHLPNHKPTSLATDSLLGHGNDRTNAALSRYYMSDKNLPWAIDIPANYSIVLEKSQLVTAYLHFSDWCLSNGTEYTDWYMNKTGYRNNSNIINR